MAKTNPFTFIQQVRSETAKVTWPSRKETGVTTLMVFIMVFLAAMFFLAADQLMSLGISFLLGF
ncbi:preprotein translocase subunit SecE [Pseudovibrio sp. Tun.PSC04-5.I4]|uniref:preprotein translocase subunit SecE n=1 Tax=Pseudovibrio sp. Tun.PSC04-5.I4 TaxID=1798213 RepID=UPI000884A2D9|nr:preprotein translocase subunit SecE [Pseudovibrio sp. Tun.PSC04-5.I4]SDR38473.1 protein translocase subunit secE/sec61 gamma [Pseudovibrio sp. Tun.PSC04-5.I4]